MAWSPPRERNYTGKAGNRVNKLMLNPDARFPHEVTDGCARMAVTYIHQFIAFAQRYSKSHQAEYCRRLLDAIKDIPPYQPPSDEQE